MGFFEEAVPDGLKLLHVAPSAIEADLLRQVLGEAGFDVEFVPAPETGVFGITGSPCIYVPDAEYAEAHAFLAEYREAPVPDPDAASTPPTREDPA